VPADFYAIISEDEMHTLPEAPASAVPAVESNFIVSIAAILCGIGLVVFICMATSGLDMTPGFF
jgi:hypothetical protein